MSINQSGLTNILVFVLAAPQFNFRWIRPTHSRGTHKGPILTWDSPIIRLRLAKRGASGGIFWCCVRIADLLKSQARA